VVKVKGRRQLQVFDATGALKFAVYPFGRGFRSLFQVTTGQFNNDHVMDVIVSASRGHKLLTKVFSGRDGSVLSSTVS
jgi:hypothetical protein